MSVNSFLAFLFLITFVLAKKSPKECPCDRLSTCEIIQQADQIVFALINSRTSDSLKITVQTVVKGSLTVGQQLTVNFDSDCFKAILNVPFLLSLSSQGADLAVDDCGFHQPKKQVSNQLNKILQNIPTKCPTKCVDRDGNEHKEGENWRLTPCEYCSCHGGEAMCAIIDCARPPCDDYFVPDGQCCPICPSGCVDQNGRLIPEGESWNPTPCEYCSCHEGAAVCAIIDCARPPCEDYYVPEGQCCPVCHSGCVDENGRTIPEGGNWNPTPCEYCSCHDGEIRCAIIDCAPPNCENSYVPEGKCCPVCDSNCVDDNGRIIPEGQSWRPSPCEYCSCSGGEIVCAVIDCAAPNCEDYYVPEGQCCPVCNSQCFDQNGRIVPEGHTWNRTPCEYCTCRGGEAQCIVINCALPACKDSYLPQGECCPRCPPDCSAVLCDPPPCNNSYVPEGECCPVCPPDCSVVDCRQDCKHPLWSKGGCCCEEACPPIRCNLDCPGGYAYDDKGCQLCQCLICPAVLCRKPPCDNPITFPGQCCPSCPVDCSAMEVLCKDLGDCQSWYIPTNQCCPVCAD